MQKRKPRSEMRLLNSLQVRWQSRGRPRGDVRARVPVLSHGGASGLRGGLRFAVCSGLVCADALCPLAGAVPLPGLDGRGRVLAVARPLRHSARDVVRVRERAK